jgi:alginate export protein
MNQTGRLALQRIEAGAFGLLGGYTFAGTAWAPRLGASIDVATGDHDARDQTLETFNPLFPKTATT